MVLLAGLLGSFTSACGGPLRDRIEERLERDVPYGDDPQQRLDVYIPRPGQGGSGHLDGAWMIGDKAASGFVSNKVAHWLPKGYIIVSSNYRYGRGEV